MAIGRVRLKILKTRISGFWREYRRSKIGMVGLFMIAGFVFLAIFGPSLSPYDPTQQMVATPLALPQWLAQLEGHSDWPPSLTFDVQWKADSSNAFDAEFREDSGLASILKREKVYVWSVRYVGNSSEDVESKSTFNFTYNYQPPATFKCSFRWRVLNLSETGYNLELGLIRYDGDKAKEYSLWDSNSGPSSPVKSTNYLYSFDIPGLPVGFPRYVELGSGSTYLYRDRLGFTSPTGFLNETFSSKGPYALVLYVRLDPKTSVSTFEVQISDFEFVTLGKVNGLLGTDDVGRDIFSRVISGARVSLLIGLLVAVGGTSIGVLVGIVSGYLGGFVDEVSMRISDLLMCLPGLPLLLAAAEMFRGNLYIAMLIIVVLSWMGLARMIRSQVLSLRESAFIEAAIVTGCTRFNLLRRHILPNVLPLAFSFMVLGVPTAILTEATLSFLGLGDPALVTWGRIMDEAMKGGALAQDAWWWLFTPAVAIVVVCLGFVFVAHAFDNIVNPRLRVRR